MWALLPAWPRALLSQLIPSGIINMFITGADRSKQDLSSWLHFPIQRGAHQAAGSTRKESPPFQDNLELAAKLLGSAPPLWLQQGPTTPGSRLRGQSSLLLAQDVPHIPAQHLKLTIGCRGQSQGSGVPRAGTTSMECFPPQKSVNTMK